MNRKGCGIWWERPAILIGRLFLSHGSLWLTSVRIRRCGCAGGLVAGTANRGTPQQGFSMKYQPSAGLRWGNITKSLTDTLDRLWDGPLAGSLTSASAGGFGPARGVRAHAHYGWMWSASQLFRDIDYIQALGSVEAQFGVQGPPVCQSLRVG
jgi:hypothetical protein